MFCFSKNICYRKPLKDANFLSVQLYINVYVYHVLTWQRKQDVPKQSEFHVGLIRLKIKNSAVVHEKSNVD